MNKIILIPLIFLVVGCSRSEVEEVSLGAALKDGFEVVCLNHDGVYLSKKLNEAKSSDCETYAISNEKVKEIEALLTKIENSSGSKYPFVQLVVNKESLTKQKILLSFHYSKDTYSYEYIVESNTVKPVSSSYRDFLSNRKVLYK